MGFEGIRFLISVGAGRWDWRVRLLRFRCCSISLLLIL